jgi:hypothetical protein
MNRVTQSIKIQDAAQCIDCAGGLLDEVADAGGSCATEELDKIRMQIEKLQEDMTAFIDKTFPT